MATNKNKTILVTGPTGHQGGAVMRHLRDKKYPVHALVRDTADAGVRKLIGHGVELVQGNLDDQGSLIHAMQDVDGVYSMQTSKDTKAEMRQGKSMADAARKSGISHFVYSSVASADQHTGVPHFDSKFQIEEHVRGTGLPYTIVRPVFFMENWLGMKDQILEGKLELPLKAETRLQMLAVDDIGAVIAMAFEHPKRWLGRAFEMAGDELSMAQLAQSFSRMIGREVKYVQIPWEVLEHRMDPAHVTMYHWLEKVGYQVDIPGVRQEYPGLHNFERWLQSTWRAAVQVEAVH
jgi:uncharacterized protein YbjT (DUF2867 family)